VLQFKRGLFKTKKSSSVPARNKRYDLSRNSFEEKRAMEIAKSLIETLKKLCLLLSEAHIKFCLIGGLAVGILAKPRATEDIDLLDIRAIEESIDGIQPI